MYANSPNAGSGNNAQEISGVKGSNNTNSISGSDFRKLMEADRKMLLAARADLQKALDHIEDRHLAEASKTLISVVAVLDEQIKLLSLF